MPITRLVHPAYYAAPQQTLGELLPILRKREDQAAIIVDEFGSAIGILTVEDILEVVVGEAKAGYRYEKHRYLRKRTFQTIEEGVYLLDARLSITEVNDVLGLNLSQTDYRTIGGLLLANLRHIPKTGEYVVDSGYRFTVEEATEKEVVTVRAQPES
jgi:CBS domain containing-hemolysin-like protein